jgi:hypothetical protein
MKSSVPNVSAKAKAETAQTRREYWFRCRDAAKLMTSQHGGRNAGAITIRAVMKLTGLPRDAIALAHQVLEHASPEEIAALDAGEVGMSGIGRAVRKRKKGVATPSFNERREENADARLLRSKLWADTRLVLETICAMPAAADVLAAVEALDRRGLVEAKLDIALLWLQEFYDERTKRDKTDGPGDGGRREDNPDPGKGDGAVGVEQPQPPPVAKPR